ncbi:alpha-1,3-arabinosyltransferase XAT3-like [Rhododendron vialii]|uniref:alpha-1,3-arabinosyltransferase XAT3-like n=1 Tax=Rhododendron vialii TaxID=182163 RepID=UPI00265FDBFD|nr:alpha-1,3-arabinosyltransferase XAT3-like [Rhododendron vialii]
MSRFSDCRKMEKVPRSLVLGATPFFCLLLLALLYTVEIGSHVVPSNQWKKTHSGATQIEHQDHLHFLMKRLVKGFFFFFYFCIFIIQHYGGNQTQLEATGFACHYDFHTELCVSSRPVRIDTLTMTVHIPFNHGMPQANRIILPYAKKEDEWIRRTVSLVQILQGNISPLPPCEYTHNDPAVVFSSGGATGNIFHEFSDIIIPLFITSRHFQSRLRFIVPDFAIRFMSKYKKIFSHLSSYEVINPAANVSVHCFPGAVVGLHYHDNLAIKTMEVPEGYSMLDFKQFLRESYNLKIRDLSKTEKPTLILISRKNKRVFMNEDEMVTMIKALGFRVIVAQPDLTANMDNFAEIVNSCSILVGAHGAGLTNAVFLPEGAVLVQVVGLGIEWIANTAFGIPAPGMGLNYIEYKIEPEESSLISLYGKDHPVIVDPGSITSKGYEILRDVYLEKQNFNIDVARFRKTLVNALGLLGRSAPLV